MDVLVCIKRVPLSGGKFTITEDGLDIETARLGFTISPHEEVAVEEAVRIVEQHGGSVTVLTLGPAEAEEQIREQMAIGADRGILIETDGQEWDPQATAAAIADAIAADETSFDLVHHGQRVGRRQRLPGGHPGGAHARPTGRHRREGHDRRRR